MRFFKLLSILLVMALSNVSLMAGEAADILLPKDPAALLQNELIRLDTLIACTQKSVEEQKKLKVLIVEYKTLQEQHLKKPQDNALLLLLVKSADKVLKAIQEAYLIKTFDPEFIEELSVLSRPLKKKAG